VWRCRNAQSTRGRRISFSGPAEATSGVISSGVYNKDFSQLTNFTQPPFVMKVRTPTADVRFRVYHPPGGTITHPAGSCTNFSWQLVGP
jgi:hypothetical protein